MDKYLYWLDRIEGLGPLAKRNLIDAYGDAENIFRASEKHLKYILDEKKLKLLLDAKEMVEMEDAFEELKQRKIHMVCYHEDGYPEKLIHIPDPPFAMYYVGKLPQNELPSVAVIGARECSSYGEYIAAELGKILGQQGIQVISGMARGIDGISQSAALNAGGVSYGVLGCGVDICYPKSNQKLYDALLINGGIISNYPPGTQPQARLFPPRNRIVSGLADVLVVIEARQKSGTSITVEMALEQGREIYAVPGRITDRLSDGCNKLIKEGAHVFLSPEDFLLDLQEHLPTQMNALYKGRCIPSYEEGEHKQLSVFDYDYGSQKNSTDILSAHILEVIDYYPQSIEEIRRKMNQRFKCDYNHEEVSMKLMQLCLLGRIKQDSSSWFSKTLSEKVISPN